jgi:hypothetical protein
MEKTYFLLTLLLIVIAQYLPVDELLYKEIMGKNTLSNHIAILISLLFASIFKINIKNQKIIEILGVILIIILINNIMAPFASTKWLMNQTGFIFITFLAAIIYSQLSANEIASLTNSVNKIRFVTLTIIVASSLWLVFNHFRTFTDGNFNSFIFQLMFFEWEKQSIGNFGLVVFAFILSLDSKNRTKYFNFIIFLLAFPLLIGIRTFTLAALLVLALLLIKNRNLLLIAIPSIFMTTWFFYERIFGSGFEKFDVRALAFLNMIDIAKHYFWGVGLGGYHIYTELHSHILESKFFWVSQYYKIFPTAPESDLVAVVASFGLFFGVLFYGFNLWIAFKLWKNYHLFDYTDRFFSIVFFTLIFSGISQDNFFTLPYWVFFGFALGIIYSNRYTSSYNYRLRNLSFKIFIRNRYNFNTSKVQREITGKTVKTISSSTTCTYPS